MTFTTAPAGAEAAMRRGYVRPAGALSSESASRIDP